MILQLNKIDFCEIARIKNKILMFGGITGSNWNYLDVMYEYNIACNKWRTLKQKLPKALAGFGCAAIFNEQFVALFGGLSIYN